MNKIILVLLLLFALIGCSNPYDTIDEQNKKIEELNKKIENNSLDLQEKCSKHADDYATSTTYSDYGDFGEQILPISYESHFNSKLNRCFIHITTKFRADDGTTKEVGVLSDAIEGKTYATYIKYPVSNYPKDTICTIYFPEFGFCNSVYEFNNLIKSYMEE